MAEHSTPTTVVEGVDEVKAADINQFVRWLTGLMNSAITLGHNGASGGPTIKLVPATNPADGTKLLQLTKADGSTERFALTADGQVALYGQLSEAKGANIASAAALDLGTDGNFFHVTGTTTITSIESRPAGHVVDLVFESALQVTHNGTSLILSGGVNYNAAAGETIRLRSEGSGNWREMSRTGSANTHRFLRKTAAETVNNSTTLQNDDTFAITVGANETWVVDLYLYFSAAKFDHALKATWTLPAGSSMLLMGIGKSTTVTTLGLSGIGTTPGTGVQLVYQGASGNAAPLFVHIHTIIRTAGTNGTAQFQWAQLSAEAADLTMAADSYMLAHQVS